MLVCFSSAREPSFVHADFLPDADGGVRETALKPEVGVVFPAILRVVADADFDGARDEVVLEESVARRRVQAIWSQPNRSFAPVARSYWLRIDSSFVPALQVALPSLNWKATSVT